MIGTDSKIPKISGDNSQSIISSPEKQQKQSKIQVKKRQPIPPKEDIMTTLFNRASVDLEPKVELNAQIDKLECEIGHESVLEKEAQLEMEKEAARRLRIQRRRKRKQQAEINKSY